MATLELDDVSKVYGDDTVAVDHLRLDIDDGEFVVLVGPSGCGKTTALRMIAGLETITDGEIRIAERVVNRVAPRDRDIAMVFQNYALYPHLTVGENLAFSLKLRKVKKDETRQRVDRAAQVLGLDGLLDRKPRQLSGGQRQRVAMGRAIVREPQAFLMDEPLSNLDAKLRVQMRAEVARIQKSLGTTTVYVTHDQTEAMTMGDRVAVLKRGVLQQIDTPQELYDHPVNVFVGGFIGSPAMNLLEAKIAEAEDGWFAEFGRHRLRIPDATIDTNPLLRETGGRPLALGIRPEHFEDASILGSVPEERRITVQVELVEHLGAEAYVHMSLDAPTVLTDDTRELAKDIEIATPANNGEAAADRASGVARVDPSTRARPGEPIELAVETDHLYFFDLESGTAIDSRVGDDS